MRIFLAILVLMVAAKGRAEVPPLLAAALEHYSADAERWAYTQTSLGADEKGKPKSDKVVRYDPSQPYEEQWTLLKINGQEPTERQAKKYRKDQEKRRKERTSFGEVLLLEEAVLLEETVNTATFEIPLKKTDNQRLPPEKFKVTARVNKQSESFETIAVRLRETLRVKLVAKVKSGEADLNFSSVDPNYAPALTTIHAAAEATVMLVKIGGSYELKREEFKRVTPYSERFKVKIAPMKFLDF